MTMHYVRNPAMALFAMGDHLHALCPGRPEARIGPTDVPALLAVLEALALPVPQGELDELTTPETARLLIERGVIVAGARDALADLLPRPPGADVDPECETLVLGVSGSSAAEVSVRPLLPLLTGFARQVHVILTDAARHFVGASSFERHGAEVWTDDYQPRGAINVPHIHLARSADAVVVWPASAATIAKVTHGLCNDLLSLTIAATEAPVVMFPAMNGAMWSNPAIARNVAQLRDDGVIVVEPGLGFELSKGLEDVPGVGVPGGGALSVDDVVRATLRAHRAAEA